MKRRAISRKTRQKEAKRREEEEKRV